MGAAPHISRHSAAVAGDRERVTMPAPQSASRVPSSLVNPTTATGMVQRKPTSPCPRERLRPVLLSSLSSMG